MVDKQKASPTQPEEAAPATELVLPPGKLPANPEEADMLAYIASLEDSLALAGKELEAKPGVESRGIAWCDLFGVTTTKEGLKYEVHISLTERSNVGSADALAGLIHTLGIARDRFALRPHIVRENAALNIKEYRESISGSSAPNGIVSPGQPVEAAASVPAAPPPAPAPAPTPPPIQAPAVPAFGAAVPAAPVPPAQTAPPQAATAGVNTMKIVKMSVSPKPEGRADLLFFLAGHKFADLKVNNWPVDNLVKLLEPTGGWTAQHFAVATTYNVNFLVDWQEGKETSKGTHYKDVVAVRLG